MATTVSSKDQALVAQVAGRIGVLGPRRDRPTGSQVRAGGQDGALAAAGLVLRGRRPKFKESD